MADSKQIDWEALATDLSSIQAQSGGRRVERGGHSLAIAAVERLLGPDQFVAAVDYYVSMRPGFELARSVLALLHPWVAMLRCRELAGSSPDVVVRRAAVELLRVVADARVLPWIDDFLDDADPYIQTCGILVLDRLLLADLADHSDCEAILARARLHHNRAVREAVSEIDQRTLSTQQ